MISSFDLAWSVGAGEAGMIWDNGAGEVPISLFVQEDIAHPARYVPPSLIKSRREIFTIT